MNLHDVRLLPDALRFTLGMSRETRPYFVSCEVTLRCNLRCEFCNIPSFNAVQNEAPAEQMLSRLREAHAMGCRMISFTGGEPLMRSDIDTLAEGCREQGYFTGLVTNGLLLGDHINAEWLHRLDAPAVSFLADEESFNRTRRHPRAYARIAGNIREAVDAGLSPVLFATLTRDTFCHAEKTAQFAHDLGLKVFFSLVQRAPREEFDTIDYAALKIADTEDALNALARLNNEYGCVRFDSDFERMQANGGFNDTIDCLAAQTVMTFKPDGSVCLPCPHYSLLSIPPEMPLAAHWSGEQATRIRRAKGTLPFCRDCQQICMHFPSLYGHPVRAVRWLVKTAL